MSDGKQKPKYQLMKELPDRKAGEIFTYNRFAKKYENGGTSNDLFFSQWDPKYVENNPDWFEEVLEKPILGIRPGYIVYEGRLEEISEAIERYETAYKEVPSIWFDERNLIMKILDEEKKYWAQNRKVVDKPEIEAEELFVLIKQLEKQGCQWQRVLWLVDDGKVTKQADTWGNDIKIQLEKIIVLCESYNFPIDKICIFPKSLKAKTKINNSCL